MTQLSYCMNETPFPPTMRELSMEETEMVSGGNPVGAAVGAATGAATYLGNASTTGEFSWGGLAYNTGAGALAGSLGGASIVVRAVAPKLGFYSGAGAGLVERS